MTLHKKLFEAFDACTAALEVAHDAEQVLKDSADLLERGNQVLLLQGIAVVEEKCRRPSHSALLDQWKSRYLRNQPEAGCLSWREVRRQRRLECKVAGQQAQKEQDAVRSEIVGVSYAM